jgi:hypothetical protein
MAKKVDPAKAKEKRQKLIAVVGAVILLALLAFEVPRVMKKLHEKPPPGSVTGSQAEAAAKNSAPGGTPSLAAPTLAGAEQSGTPAAVSADGVTSGDVAPPPQEGQLASFSLFVSKDPFAQQLQTSSATSAGAGTSSGSSSGSGSSTGGSGSSTGGSVPTGPTGSQPAPGSAVISVNGTLMSVTVGGDFPADQPLFHLVSLTAHTARISIVGGSYANGAPSVTLRENKPVTLMNTADGTRYKLVLKQQGTPIPSSSSTTTTPTSTTPTSTTTPAP